MKILVLAGGLSPERNVSLSSGAMVCEALRERGHQAAMMDLFYGLDGALCGENLYMAPIPDAFKRVARQAPDLAQVRAARKEGRGFRNRARCAGDVRRGGCCLSGPPWRLRRGLPYSGCSGSFGSALHWIRLSGLRHRYG